MESVINKQEGKTHIANKKKKNLLRMYVRLTASRCNIRENLYSAEIRGVDGEKLIWREIS